MRVKLLTLQFAPGLGGFDDRPLVEFLADKQVLAVREHFFVVHEQPHLACLVTYQEAVIVDAGSARPEASAPTTRNGRRRADPTRDLPPPQRELYANLRDWRAERARHDGVPAYVLFTNRELAAIVTARPATRSALLHVPGVGPGKVERYGAEILSRLGAAEPNDLDASSTSAADPRAEIAPATADPS